MQTYILNDNHYYDNPKYNHTYGAYIDIPYNHPLFNVIESVSMSGYLLPNKVDGKEFFYGEKSITKRDLLHFLFILKDYNKSNRLNKIGRGLTSYLLKYKR